MIAKTLCLLAVVGAACGLTCWKTENDKFLHILNFDKIISEETCASNDKSCMAQVYNVGKHVYYKLGCSDKEATTDCKTTEKGSRGKLWDCYCSGDYCNSAVSNSPAAVLSAVAAALALLAASGVQTRVH